VFLDIDLKLSQDLFDFNNLLGLLFDYLLGHHGLAELELDRLVVCNFSSVIGDDVWVVSAIAIVSEMHNCYF